MATIQTAIKVNDGMTAGLRAMMKALNITTASFEKMQMASNNAIDTESLKVARQELAKAQISFNAVENEIAEATEQQENFNRSIRAGTEETGGLLRTVRNIAVAVGGITLGRKLVEASDQYAGIQARLSLINDGQQTVAELNDMILRSANRARGSYVDMADVIGKLGITASHSFSNNKEIVAFAEVMNKSFKIAGASAQEQSAAMYQLTQAMASGRLQGDEFRSILENAPMLAQAIATEMDVTIGKLKELSSDGAITADIIKKALFNSAEEINKQFENMPVTFGQAVTIMGNNLRDKLEPAFIRLSQWLNSDEGARAIEATTAAMARLAEMISIAVQKVMGFAGYVQENFAWIAPLVWGIVAAYVAWNGAITAFNVVAGISAGAKSIMAAKTMLQTGATFAATKAQWGLNAAMMASPVALIVGKIILVIAIIYALVGAYNKLTGKTYSATGIIAGLFGVMGGAIYNTVANLWNTFAIFAEFLANVFRNPVFSILKLFTNLADNVFNILRSIAQGIDKIFGSRLESSIGRWQSGMNAWVDRMKPEDYVDVHRMEYKDVVDSFKAGYAVGEKIISKFKLPELDLADPGAGFDFDAINSALESINEDTSKIKDAVDMSQEDLKYLRDLAEQEVINRFTTAQITVDMKNEFGSVNSNMDLDGVIAYLEEKVSEAMNVAAEGV